MLSVSIECMYVSMHAQICRVWLIDWSAPRRIQDISKKKNKIIFLSFCCCPVADFQ